MMLKWFDTGEVVAFAEELVREVDKQSAAKPNERKKVSKKNRDGLDRLVLRVREFSKKTPLNIYKKAKLLNVVKWRLRESGYEDKFINELVMLFTAALNS